MMLKSSGHVIETATQGQEAIEKTRTTAYDLVLMDIEMPVLDGLAATLAIRKREREQGRPALPIIALTAHDTEEARKKTADAGCQAHLVKPVKKTEFLETIRRLTS